MANKTHLKIMTPNGLFMDEDVSLVTLKTTVGYIGIQHGKSPIVASVEISEISIAQTEGKPKVAAIAGGIVYVTPQSIDIITDAIEWKEHIDASRAEKAKREAEAALKHKSDEAELIKNELALKRAINRISVKRN